MFPQDVGTGGSQQEQATSLENKVKRLTAEMEALRTQIAAVELSLASLKAATGRLALKQGVGSSLLSEFGVAAPTYAGVPVK
jgi:prefoldin subunit 5